MNHSDALQFITSGKAKFYLKNLISGNELHYTVLKIKDDVYRCYSQVYLFTLVKSGERWLYYLPKDKVVSREATVLTQYLDSLPKGPKSVEIHHIGQCGVCGRPLKDEESKMRGIGPVCYARLLSSK